MSRRCRASLQNLSSGGSAGSSDLGAGCSCLRLGKGEACVEPLVYGASLAPSFEQLITLTDGGPSGDEIPYSANTLTAPFLWFSDGSDAIIFRGSVFPYNWIQRTFSSDPNWKISTANPDTGTYHMRAGPGDWQTTEEKNNSDLAPLNFIECGGGLPPSAYWRAEPGALVTVSIRAEVAAVTANTEQIRLGVEFVDIAGNPIGGGWAKITALTTSYATYEFSVFAPAATFYTYGIFRSARNNPGTAVDSTFDFDNPIFGITSPIGSYLLCSEAALITIDNSTTETSFV